MKFHIKYLLLICVLLAGASFNSVWGQSDVYTSNVMLSTSSGTKVTAAKVKLTSNGTQYDAIKLGTSSNSGNGYITVPAGTTILHVHCAGWNGDGNSRTLNLSTSVKGVTISPASMSLTNDAGISSSSPFTLSTPANASTSYYASFTLTGVTANTQIELATSSKRAVYWGINAEIGITSIAFSAPKTAIVGVGDNVTLTPTVLPATYTEAIDWESDNTSIATVSSAGLVTGVAEGTAHITAKSHRNPTTIYDVCEVTVSGTAREEVNMLTFSATNTTLIVGGSPNMTTTSVTNDQPGWTAAYTYTSSNEGVATVNSSGVITAVAKGTATITCSLNVDNDDPDYKAGSTTSKTVEITVNKPSHTVTFSVNGSTTRTAIVEEDQPITFPTAVETPSVASEFPKVINGMTFVGWYSSTYSHATDAPSYVNTASTNMGTSNVTYYAVYAEEDTDEEEVTKSYGFETESDVNWTVTGPTRNGGRANTGSYSGYINVNNSYVTFKNKVKVTEFSFAFTRTSTNNNYNVYIETSTDNSTWKAVETYAMSTFNSDGTYSVKSHTFDGKTALYVRFHCYNTTADRYVDDVTIKYNSTVTTYKNYCTTILGLPIPVTLNASGYATFCSEYPLDFSDYATSDYSAWQITGVDGESITFSQITGSIKGGQGILLKGEASDEIILTNANSATVLSSNFLVGTVAPMSISADEYYGLSGNKFVKVNAGTVPAGKALLPASAISASARELKFVFEGDETTSITENLELRTENAVYDLQGRKVTKPVKGGLYIVNGRKFINK